MSFTNDIQEKIETCLDEALAEYYINAKEELNKSAYAAVKIFFAEKDIKNLEKDNEDDDFEDDEENSDLPDMIYEHVTYKINKMVDDMEYETNRIMDNFTGKVKNRLIEISREVTREVIQNSLENI